MTALDTEKNKEQSSSRNLFLEFPWFYDNIYERLQGTAEEFFQKDYFFRFIGVSYNDENILFYGDEYFVNKIPVNNAASAVFRISSGFASALLDDALGACSSVFSLSKLTDIEAGILKAFTLFIYKKLEGLLIKKEPDKKTLKKSKIYNFTFYAKSAGEHRGKLIISIPDYVLSGNIEFDFREDNFSISSFSSTEVLVTIRAGSARVPLNDLKAIETGDIIILDNSSVSRMELLWNGNTAEFNITPNPALIISIDKNNDGEDTMSSDTPKNNESMWDTIMVDVTAEFDGFKMTLGELKQISEGLLVDIGSVYDGKVKLKAAKQVIASGGLVILNDRYGVRIDTINNPDENPEETEEDDENYEDDAQDENEDEDYEETEEPKPKNAKRDKTAAGDKENFDYSDFEIEDESI